MKNAFEISFKTFFFTTMVVAITAFAVSWSTLQDVRRALLEGAQSSSQSFAGTATEKLDSLVDENLKTLRALVEAEQSAPHGLGSEAIQNFQNTLDSSTDLISLSTFKPTDQGVDKEIIFLVNDQALADVAEDLGSLKTLPQSEIKRTVALHTQGPSVINLAPIFKKPVLSVAFSENGWLARAEFYQTSILASLKDEGGRHGIIVDLNGQLLSHWDLAQLIQGANMMQAPLIADFIKDKNFHDPESFSAFQRSHEFQFGTLATSSPEKFINDEVAHDQRRAALLACVALAFSLLVAFIFNLGDGETKEFVSQPQTFSQPLTAYQGAPQATYFQSPILSQPLQQPLQQPVQQPVYQPVQQPAQQHVAQHHEFQERAIPVHDQAPSPAPMPAEVAPEFAPDLWFLIRHPELGTTEGPYNVTDLISIVRAPEFPFNKALALKQGTTTAVQLWDVPGVSRRQPRTEKIEAPPVPPSMPQPTAEQAVKGELWYVSGLNQELEGPYTTGQLIKMVEKGTLTYARYCWKPGLEHWITIHQIPGFDRRDQNLVPHFPESA